MTEKRRNQVVGREAARIIAKLRRMPADDARRIIRMAIIEAVVGPADNRVADSLLLPPLLLAQEWAQGKLA